RSARPGSSRQLEATVELFPGSRRSGVGPGPVASPGAQRHDGRNDAGTAAHPAYTGSPFSPGGCPRAGFRSEVTQSPGRSGRPRRRWGRTMSEDDRRSVPARPPPQNGTPKRVHTTSQAPIDGTGSPSGAVPTPQDAPATGAAPAREAARATVALRERVGAYVALTKPRIIELLLVTTVPTMILAQGGLPGLGLILATLVGGTLAAASANVYNCYLDRDIDQVMNRTKRRPLVTGEVSPRAALVFATVLGVVSLVWFALLVNVVSAWLTFAAIAIYVVGYTMILKRRTPQNIVWGGIAGCMPVLIGWSAVTGSLSWAALA